MKQSLRARRMARNHRRLQAPRLNLVALMDIFTILVLFLMVNNGDVEVLQADSSLTLPDSVAAQRPEAALVIKVTRDDIRVAEQSVVTLADALAAEGPQLPALAATLRWHQAQAGRAAGAPLAGAPAIDTAASPGNSAVAADDPEAAARQIIVMADRDMPYTVLKRIMATCAASEYRDIALAVNSTAPDVRNPAAVERQLLEPLLQEGPPQEPMSQDGLPQSGEQPLATITGAAG